MKGTVRVGIGGWTFAPWSKSFYPKNLSQSRELEYASRQLTSIEINGTYYRTQKAESFARWYEETPENFVFALKGPRFATNRRNLAEAEASIERFFKSGVMNLKEKLGPINWQFLPTKHFDVEDFEAFLKLLPKTVEGHEVRHALEVRHDSFRTAEFVACLRSMKPKRCSQTRTSLCKFRISHRLSSMRVCSAHRRSEENGYPDDALDVWSQRALTWSQGKIPKGLEAVTSPWKTPPRDVFIYFINGFKPKAPAAAMALIKRLN